MTVHVEVCVDSIESAASATRGGADAVELCSDLNNGGVTSSLGTIHATCEATAGHQLGVLIRPRAGDFVFSPAEHTAMRRDIQAARDTGCDGVALGVLTPEGDIDTERMRALIEEARPLQVTFHRAFDRTRDWEQAFGELLELGVDRVLTSGQQRDAEAGAAMLTELVRRAGSRLVVVPAGAIRLSNARNIIETTGARALHVGSAVSQTIVTPSTTVALGPGGTDDENGRQEVQVERVRELVQQLQ
jgi:copper homeostasis protein